MNIPDPRLHLLTRGEMMIHQGKYDAAMQEIDGLLPRTVVYAEDGRIMKKGLSSLEDPPQQVSSAIDGRQFIRVNPDATAGDWSSPCLPVSGPPPGSEGMRRCLSTIRSTPT